MLLSVLLVLEAQLQELQNDAWKLQMFAELDKMRQQLELLQPLDKDSQQAGEGDSMGSNAVKAGADSAKAFTYDDRPEDLVALDAEIAALDAQLKVGALLSATPIAHGDGMLVENFICCRTMHYCHHSAATRTHRLVQLIALCVYAGDALQKHARNCI